MALSSYLTHSYPPKWVIEDKQSTTSFAHAATLAEWETPTVWIIKPEDSCIVLGNSQREKPFLDISYIESEGLNITSRCSGGGAVLVSPGDLLWVDVFIPKNSRLWHDDIKQAALWLGEIWVAALRSISIDCIMNTQSLLRSPLTDLVCFAGKAPGEVFINDQKIIGISQRRSNKGTRYQCALALKWNPAHLINVFRNTQIENVSERIQSCGTEVSCTGDEALQAFLEQLTTH
ncbi:MAG: hypothetical protein VX754_07330 [Actinomycetota bacterium]|nr:hypothetical protein [Actinomycetota bacterium]MED5230700.1 hypothetical protein [Actinomycetota bacterium]